MVKLPSQEQIDALQPYFMALGKVAHSWNHLHQELGKVFCALTKLKIQVGMAAWHGLKSDRSQREMLEGVLNSISSSPSWNKRHPGAKTGIKWLINQTDELAIKRNDAIHAPCDVRPSGTDFEIVPITFFHSQTAKRLLGKDILKRFAWYEASAHTLTRYASASRFALDARTPWPDKPRPPELQQ
jgi:hypothetical protein